jgi:hypothetical protein
MYADTGHHGRRVAKAHRGQVEADEIIRQLAKCKYGRRTREKILHACSAKYTLQVLSTMNGRAGITISTLSMSKTISSDTYALF